MTIYYVAKDGSGNYTTIQQAVDIAIAGDIIYIRAGIYSEQVSIKNSGTAGNPITISSYPGEKAIIDGTNVNINQPAWDGLVQVRGQSYITIQNLQIKNSKWFGIFLYQGTNLIVKNNYIYNTAASGILVHTTKDVVIDGNELELNCNSPPPAYPEGVQEIISMALDNDRFEIKNNYIHDGGRPTLGGEGIDAKNGIANGKIYHNLVRNVNSVGIYIDAWDKTANNIEVYQNVVHDVGGSGFAVSAEEVGGASSNINIYNNIAYNGNIAGIMIPSYGDGAVSNVKVINNVFYNFNQGGAWLGSWGGPISDIVIRNNIFSKNPGGQIRNDKPAATVTIDHNLIDTYLGWKDETRGSNYIESDPQFINPSNGDFHLQNTSPAIDQGSFIDAPITDFDGILRPQGLGYDMGAFEHFTILPCPLLNSILTII